MATPFPTRGTDAEIEGVEETTVLPARNDWGIVGNERDGRSKDGLERVQKVDMDEGMLI